MSKSSRFRHVASAAALSLLLVATSVAEAEAGPTVKKLTVTVDGPGTVTGPGIACPGDCTEFYANGTSVTLIANPGPSGAFKGWTRACRGTGGCTIAMTTGRLAIATFADAPAPTEPPPSEPPPSDPPPVEQPVDPACAWGAFSASNQPGACWRPYSSSSPFNVGVGTSPKAVANSSSIVSRTVGFGAAGTRGGTMFTGGVADTSSDYDHPIYYSKPSDPLYTVRCRKWVSGCTVEGAQVRIPAQARPAGGSDAHMSVIDQDAGWEYGFWQTEARSPSGGTLWIGHGGRTRIGTPDATGLGSSTNPNAVTAAHFGLAAGVIRPEELAAGRINHALFMTVKCTNGTFVWPAGGPGVGRTCASLGLSNENAPALGQHFYLAMTAAEIDALPVPAWKKTVLRAMSEYGMFVGDTGSSFLGYGIVVQSGSSYTSFGQSDPWVSLAKQFGIPQSSGGKYYFDLRDTIDWGSKLRVADPCVSRREC